VTLNAAAPHVRDFVLATVASEIVRRPAQREGEPFAFELAALEGTYLGPGGGFVRARFEREAASADRREHKRETLLSSWRSTAAAARAAFASTTAFDRLLRGAARRCHGLDLG
jgi:hypothetical protein